MSNHTRYSLLPVTLQEFLDDIFDGRTATLCERLGKSGSGFVPILYKTCARDAKPGAQVTGLGYMRNDRDHYFQVCSAKAGASRVREEDMEEAVVFFLDDVGRGSQRGKDADRILGKPQYIVETSPGNTSWYYVLSKGERRLDLYRTCVKAAKEQGLTDRGGGTVAKWMRLPSGANTKHTPPFVVRGWNVGNAVLEVGLDDIARALGVDVNDPSSWDTGRTPGRGRVRDQAHDVVWRSLEEAGMVRGSRPGTDWIDIYCPWEEEHSSDTPSGTGYLPSVEGGVFHCLHDHCAERGFGDLVAWLEKQGHLGEPVVAEGEFSEVDGGATGSPALDEMLDTYIFLRKDRKYYEVNRGFPILVETLNDLHSHWFPGRTSPHRIFQNNADPDIHIADGLTYAYRQSRRITVQGQDLINTWNRDVKKVPAGGISDAEVQPYLDLCAHVIGDKKLLKLWYDWCGFVIATSEKPHWHWILSSIHQGIGKDSILLPLIWAVGDANYNYILPFQLEGTFNEFLEARLIVTGEIMSSAQTKADRVYSSLKSYWASPPHWVPMNCKNQHTRKVHNGTAWVMTSNSPRPIALDEHDRRTCLIFSDAKPLPDKFYGDFYDWLEKKGGCEKAGLWLVQRGASLTEAERDVFRTRAPDTEAKRDAALLGMTAVEAYVHEHVGDESLGWPDVERLDKLLSRITAAINLGEISGANSNDIPSSEKFGHMLRNAGAVRYFRKVRYSGKTAIVYILRNEKKYEKFTVSKIRDATGKVDDSNVVDDVF